MTSRMVRSLLVRCVVLLTLLGAGASTSGAVAVVTCRCPAAAPARAEKVEQQACCRRCADTGAAVQVSPADADADPCSAHCEADCCQAIIVFPCVAPRNLLFFVATLPLALGLEPVPTGWLDEPIFPPPRA